MVLLVVVVGEVAHATQRSAGVILRHNIGLHVGDDTIPDGSSVAITRKTMEQLDDAVNE